MRVNPLLHGVCWHGPKKKRAAVWQSVHNKNDMIIVNSVALLAYCTLPCFCVCYQYVIGGNFIAIIDCIHNISHGFFSPVLLSLIN